MSAPASQPLPRGLPFLHGLGSIAYGIKDNGFSTFLMLYCNQVLGMDSRLVGLALMVALVIDGFVDPLIGYLSDRTVTNWGRRLPWLYLAPVPLALVWIALWSLTAAPGFWGLVGLAAAVRILVSACEVPSVALVPELTQDYDERTTLMRKWFDLMMANQEDLAQLMTAEQGKPLTESRGEIAYGAGYIEWFGEEAKRIYGETIPGHQRDKRIHVLKQPIGVAASIKAVAAGLLRMLPPR